MAGVPSDSTPLDRDEFSFVRCEKCNKRRTQLVIDRQPHNRDHGNYERSCWQCYWQFDLWKHGPIVNCGPAWDSLDVRRGETMRPG